MKREHQRIDFQLGFAILDALLSDHDYLKSGIKNQDLVAKLAPNRALWLQTGRAKTTTFFEARVKFMAATLVKEGALNLSDGHYTLCVPQYEDVLVRIASELHTALDLELIFDEAALTKDATLEGLQKGTIQTDCLSGIDDQNILMLSPEQTQRLAYYLVLHDIILAEEIEIG